MSACGRRSRSRPNDGWRTSCVGHVAPRVKAVRPRTIEHVVRTCQGWTMRPSDPGHCVIGERRYESGGEALERPPGLLTSALWSDARRRVRSSLHSGCRTVPHPTGTGAVVTQSPSQLPTALRRGLDRDRLRAWLVDAVRCDGRSTATDIGTCRGRTGICEARGGAHPSKTRRDGRDSAG